MEKRMRDLLQGAIRHDGGLYNLGPPWYLYYGPYDRHATLDGAFTADELDAIAQWMRQHPASPDPQESTK